MVTATRTRDDSNENKMLAWAVHLMKMHRYNVTTIDPAAGARPCGRVTALARPESPSRRVAKSPSRRVANFSRVAESRVAAPRLGATRPTLVAPEGEEPAALRRARTALGVAAASYSATCAGKLSFSAVLSAPTSRRRRGGPASVPRSRSGRGGGSCG